jgi:hypothetical protein
MRLFSIDLVKILLLTIFLGFSTDFLIKEFFYNVHHRSKPDVRGVDSEVVFFGSSRCVNTIVPDDFYKLSGYSSYNMGWAASNPREIYAAIKIFLKNNKHPKFICIQVDAEHSLIEEDNLAKQSLLKYYNKGIIDEYFSDKTNFEMAIPLYSSMINRDFGWREMLKTFFSNRYPENGGYAPINNIIENPHDITPQKISNTLFNNKSVWIQKSIQICMDKNINVVLFTSPYFKLENPESFNKLEMYDITYWNFSNSITEYKYFSDPSHLNDVGARLFTKQLANSFLVGTDTLRIPLASTHDQQN